MTINMSRTVRTLFRVVGPLTTHGYINLTTLLVKHYNDLLTRRRSGRARNKVTYFSVGDGFCIHLGTTYTNFQEKNFPETSGRKLGFYYKYAV